MSEFGLVYPACVNEMRFQEPIVIYRHHKMDKEMVENKVDSRVKYVRDNNSKKIAFVMGWVTDCGEEITRSNPYKECGTAEACTSAC